MSFSDDWRRLEPQIARALKHTHGTHETRDVMDAIIRGDAQFWPGDGSVIVTEVVVYPRMKAVRVWLAAGDFSEVRQIEGKVAEWARSIGAARLEMSGRRGWSRRLPEWRETGVTMMRALG